MDGGRHQYPFSFVLPTAIPSSFEGAHGHVRYTIRAVFQRPRKFNYESKIPFTVNSPLDLNTFPELTVSLSPAFFTRSANIDFSLILQGFGNGF